MNKILLVLAFILISFSSFGQYKEQFRAMHGYEMGIDKGFFGINFTGEYFPLNYFSIAPSFTFFTPATGNARGFDLNARYYFTEKERQWYTTVGYGHYTRVYEFNPIGRESFNSLNLGGGSMIKLNDEIGLNPEVRYQLGRNDLLFKLSILYFVN
ncbi:MAG: hypothetical protein EA341_13195 [Mongoliibacter sp.]|uniref:hypothetical protein n=1 Tax=Mongoliibacter sp. TaxID=2022438 RepID=UPI0012F1C037|nr:hypothetical protein [Mongoliibacter sp.]TVP47016.1 MAG: hypothetical protein EA341_13195 [Mongoliibacter sp.]